jgi:hypothetical protein
MHAFRSLAFAAAMLGAAGAAQAAPILFDIHFTNTVGSITPSGSFTYDSTTQTFSNFVVDFDGLSFDFTTSANAPASFGLCGGSISGFGIMSGSTGCATNQVWNFLGDTSIDFLSGLFFASPAPFMADTANLNVGEAIEVFPATALGFDGDDGGTFTISAASTPEPSIWAMMLLGFVGLGLGVCCRSRRTAHSTASA